MLHTVQFFVASILRLFRARRRLWLENLALRQQLAVLKRKHPRPHLTSFNNLFWIFGAQKPLPLDRCLPRLALSVRFGYGDLHLTSVARVLPEGKEFKSSYKWLSRFRECKYFDPSSLAEWLLALILGRKPRFLVIVLVDQTTIAEAAARTPAVGL